MKRFLKNIAIISAVCLAILIIGELIVRNMPTSYSYKNQWLENNAEEVELLILGPSHTYYGLKPELLDYNAFNLANVSQTPEYDQELLEKWITRMPRLKYIVLSTSYYSFREGTLEEIDNPRCNNYKIAMGINVHSDFSKYNFALSDFSGYFGKLRNLVLPQNSNICDSLGFGLGFDLTTRDPRWKEKGDERVGELTYSKNLQRQKNVIECFNKIAKTASDHGAECIVVITPTWETFRQNADPIQLQEFISITENMCKQNGFMLLNLFSSQDFTEDDFHDVDHMSDKGAEKLSRILNAAIPKNC
ncbi:MAG: DUF1574 domain-containing protein [Candidatus Amulumruptor caecigallinarius]|nr:DUF1574 domain-containing protein [Candidatus Amulumruptor caecigallinarius]